MVATVEEVAAQRNVDVARRLLLLLEVVVPEGVGVKPQANLGDVVGAGHLLQDLLEAPGSPAPLHPDHLARLHLEGDGVVAAADKGDGAIHHQPPVRAGGRRPLGDLPIGEGRLPPGSRASPHSTMTTWPITGRLPTPAIRWVPLGEVISTRSPRPQMAARCQPSRSKAS